MSCRSTGRPAFETVFLDRDGTINAKAADGDYIKSVAEFVFLPGAKEALCTLTDHGLRAIVVTNQRGIALGRMSEADLAAIHGHMLTELAEAGARVDAVYHCPHDRDECICRKPGIGMFLRAERDHPGLDFAASVVIGDSWSDMEAAASLGVRRVLIAAQPRTGETVVPLDHCAESIVDAVEWVVRATETG